VAFYHHSYTSDRAYLITNTRKFFYTVNAGERWAEGKAPTLPNTFWVQLLQFHPESDYLIWTGSKDCEGSGENCRAQAHYTRDNGQTWKFIEDYVKTCAWAKDNELTVDPTQILCESYRDKRGSQRDFRKTNNPLELISGTQFYEKKTKVFDHVAGFTKFWEYLIVAEVCGRDYFCSLVNIPFSSIFH
jgi:hypothetical protein